MSNEEREVIQKVKDYILKCGGSYSAWYTGIAQDPKLRLFNDHTVDEKADSWIYHPVSSSTVARNIEQYFVETLGTDGGTGGGDDSTKTVYAYKKNYRTNP